MARCLATRRTPPTRRSILRRGDRLDRNAPGFQLRWLMFPVAWVLLLSSLSLPNQPYTGTSVSPTGRVGVVEPGSPGDIAGLHSGDLLLTPKEQSSDLLSSGPLSLAESGVPLVLERERD